MGKFNQFFKRFNQDWSKSLKRTVGIKFILDCSKQDEQILSKWVNQQYKMVRFYGKQMYYEYQNPSDQLKEAEEKGNDLVLSYFRSKYRSQVRKYFEDHNLKYLHKNGKSSGTSLYENNVVEIAHESYRSYICRNKKIPKEPISFRKPVLRFSKNSGNLIRHHLDEVTPVLCSQKKDENGNLVIKGYNTFLSFQVELNKLVKIPCYIPKSMYQHINKLKDNFGGNLFKQGNKWIYMVSVVTEHEWAYEPVGAIGFDLNKDNDYSVALSNNNVILKTDKIIKLEEALKKENDRAQVHNGDKYGIKSKQRSKIRNKIKRIHSQLYNLYTASAEKLVDYAIENKLLICMDTVTTGQQNGSFGQDKLPYIIKDLSEYRKAPFVQVPTPYTTRQCNKCKYVHEAKIEGNEFKCEKCGHEDITHFNAAKNIRDIGLLAWKKGLSASLGEYGLLAKTKKRSR